MYTYTRQKALYLHGKRWYYFLVVAKEGEYKTSRALMNDYNLNAIASHLVVAYTPAFLGLKQNGDPHIIFAFFESYIEFYSYLQNFLPEDRNFFEVIFGELPQKPHFDIDVKASEISPEDNIDTIADTIKDAVISGCIEVLKENQVSINIAKDILLYKSHGETKRSYHVVINNKCHDGHEEAKEFYKLVVAKASMFINPKYLIFIDKGVYSPRQQFRLIGSQKLGSNRPKVFCQRFEYHGITYVHEYTEDTEDLTMRKLIVMYESLVSFTSGCSFIPSLIPPKQFSKSYNADMADLSDTIVHQCMNMLKSKMNHCPFSIKQITGHLILLKRNAPSHCPICDRIHEKDHPFMFIISGKVYWNCRRNETENFFIGYSIISFDDVMGTLNDQEENDDGEGQFMFGGYDMGTPMLEPTKQFIETKNEIIEPKEVILDKPIEERKQNIIEHTREVFDSWSKEKYEKKNPSSKGSLSTIEINIFEGSNVILDVNIGKRKKKDNTGCLQGINLSDWKC